MCQIRKKSSFFDTWVTEPVTTSHCVNDDSESGTSVHITHQPYDIYRGKILASNEYGDIAHFYYVRESSQEIKFSILNHTTKRISSNDCIAW